MINSSKGAAMQAGAFREGDAERLVSSGGRRYVAGMRVFTLIPVSVAGVAAADGLRMRLTVIAAMALLAGWSVVYVRQVLAERVVISSIIDAIVLVGLMIATPHLIPEGWLRTNSSWLRPFTTFAGVGYQYSTPWPVGVGLGAVLCLVESLAMQAAKPGPPGLDDVITAVWSFLSIMLARLLWTLVTGAGRKVDAVFAATAKARREQEVAAGIRADQRAVTNALHDTAASTLLMVGLGWAHDLQELRNWAKRDLEILGRIKPGTLPNLPVDVCGELGRLGESQAFAVVFLGPDRLEVTASVGQALIGAAAEALANIRRHAGTDIALIKVTGTGSRIEVEIRDRGSGFDPTTVPATRRGVRDSILGRLREVGGSAEIGSAPGAGTTVRLVWPHG